MTWDESGDPPAVEPASLRACIPRDLRDPLAAKVREVAESPDAALFAEPVGVEDYHKIVPVPMDLGLILRRLEKVQMSRFFVGRFVRGCGWLVTVVVGSAGVFGAALWVVRAPC